jgi:hypothetical protein
MNRNLSIFAFILGLLAVIWVTVGYIGGSGIALAVSCIIAAVYLAGALEMRRFDANTAALAKALNAIPDDLSHLGEWLQHVPAALKNSVRCASKASASPCRALASRLTSSACSCCSACSALSSAWLSR